MTTEIMPGVETVILEDVVPYEDSDDPNRKSHYVNTADNMDLQRQYGRMKDGQDVIDTARLLGLEVVALCGYKWVPKHNPKAFPVCPRCAEIAGDILIGEM